MPYLHPTVTIFLRRNAIYVAEKKPACALDETQPGGPMAFACFLIQTGSGDDMPSSSIADTNSPALRNASDQDVPSAFACSA
jgi:hypothetical protein